MLYYNTLIHSIGLQQFPTFDFCTHIVPPYFLRGRPPLIQWLTSLFDLTFAEPIRWAKVRSKYLP